MNTPESETVDDILKYLITGLGYEIGEQDDDISYAKRQLKQSIRLMMEEVIGNYSCPYPDSCKGDKFNGICLGKEVLTKEQRKRLDRALTKYFGEEYRMGKTTETVTSTLSGCNVIVTRDNGLWHLSISHPLHLPTYDDLKNARYRYLPDVRYVAQIFPPENEFVNVHPNCLHLWELSKDNSYSDIKEQTT